MEYSKPKLKSSGGRASPSFSPFLIGNMSGKFLSTSNLLHVSVRHIFISLSSFRVIANSVRMLHKPVVYSQCRLRYAGFVHILGTSALDLHYVSDCWLEVSIRKVRRPSTSIQVFLGFPVPKSKCWDGSQDSKLPLHASHVALPT